MDLTCKINQKHFDDILNGCKKVEYRQFETITLNAPNGQSATMDIESVRRCSEHEDEEVREIYDEVPWNDDHEIHAIHIGKFTRHIRYCFFISILGDKTNTIKLYIAKRSLS